MKIQRVLIALTGVNLALLVLLLVQAGPVGANSPAVLRGRALEIVDDQGKVRASIQVYPASKTPKGETYPETTLLRLIDPNGRPSVKLSTSVPGAILMLQGEGQGTYLQLKGEDTSIRALHKDGRLRILKP
jgi:hypothetical protein